MILCNEMEYIKLDLSQTSSLDFSYVTKRLEKIDSSSITIELDFGLTKENTSSLLHSNFFLETVYNACENFQEKVLDLFNDKDIHIVLYRGCCNFLPDAISSQKNMYYFSSWLHDMFTSNTEFHAFIGRPLSRDDGEQIVECQLGSILYNISVLDRLSSFLLRVSSIHSDVESTSVSFIDVGMSRLEQSMLGSSERFDHIDVKFESEAKAETSINIAVCIPFFEKCNSSVVEDLRLCLNHLDENKIAYKTFSEMVFTESWNEIDTIIVMGKSFDQSLERKCTGFKAALGEIISCGQTVDKAVEYELFENWLERVSG